MEIDYELVERIGATHYSVVTSYLYKASNSAVLLWKDENWSLSSIDAITALMHLKPIQPKPQVRHEYEKVDMNCSDNAYWCLARDWSTMDAPNLFWSDGNDYSEVDSHDRLLREYKCRNIYRRIEKPVDSKKLNAIGEIKALMKAHNIDVRELMEDDLK